MRGDHAASSVLALTLAFASPPPAALPGPSSPTPGQPAFELRLAFPDPGPGRRAYPVPPGAPGAAQAGSVLYVSDAALLSMADLSSVKLVLDEEEHGLELHVRPDAAKALTAVTGSHIGDRIAMFVDGRLMSVPILIDRLSDVIWLHGAFSDEELAALARRLTDLIAGPGPGAPAPAVLAQLQPRLRVLLERYHPGIRLEVGAAGLSFEHDTRTFQVPEYVKAGEPRRVFDVKGPSPCEAGRKGHGILGSVQVVPGKYAGQRAVVPGVFFQSGHEEHFDTLWGVVPSPQEAAYLDVNLTYPACTDPAFLKEFREIVQDAWRGMD